ncbi:MAG: DUF1697 domain-containing protein, partial [Acidimicrobiia bacterium]
LESLGYAEVRTVIVSGNAVFSAKRKAAAALETQIERAIESKLGLDVKVLVRSAAELDAVVRQNPFLKRKVDPKQLHASFLWKNPSKETLEAVNPKDFLPDEFEVRDRVIYIRAPNGVAGSKMPNWDKFLGMPTTQRNWNTVTRLHDLTRGG